MRTFRIKLNEEFCSLSLLNYENNQELFDE